MSPDAFAARLKAATKHAVPSRGFGDSAHIRAVADRLASKYGDGVDFDLDIDRTGRAYDALLADRPLGDRGLMRLCAAVTTPVGERPPIVQDSSLVDRLAARVNALQRPEARARCAMSLVWAWVHPATAPWNTALPERFTPLRVWAEQELRSSATQVREGSLLEVARDLGPVLLTPSRGDAAAAFTDYVLNDDDAVRVPLDRLRVPEASWIWPEILLGAIDHVCQGNAAQLVRFLDQRRPLERLDQHPLVRNEGLGRLLRAYSQKVPNTPERDDLRDASIEAFGNPRSQDTHAKWDMIAGSDARRMVNRWLIGRIIEYGFTTLPGVGADPRRAPFWMRYAEHFEDIWIHVGYDSRAHRGHVVRQMREMLDGQVRDLDAETTDVFIFTIGNFEIVEFTTTGDACYIYHRDSLKPYDVRKSQHRNADFKHRGTADGWLTHSGSWELKFMREIADRTGKRPTYAAIPRKL